MVSNDKFIVIDELTIQKESATIYLILYSNIFLEGLRKIVQSLGKASLRAGNRARNFMNAKYNTALYFSVTKNIDFLILWLPLT